MKLPVLTSVIIFIILLFFLIKKSAKDDQKIMDDFLEKEKKSNNVRKKSLDDLDYIKIPEDFFNMKQDDNDPVCHEAIRMLDHLKDKEIVNLTGISNTDLKLTYGTANLNHLAACDSNFTQLARALQSYSEYLVKQNEKESAIKVLEFAVEKGSDISSSYKLLASLYKEKGELTKKDGLKEKAASLNSAMSESIVNALDKI